MKRWLCILTAHDWFALAYPPARRWECLRCGKIVEIDFASDGEK